MSFLENARELQTPPSISHNEQRECVQTDCQAERAALNVNVTEQWSDLPNTAVEYLTVKCQRPEHLPIAMKNVRELLKADPSALDDPDLAEFELDECLAQAEIAAKTDQRSANAETIAEKHEVLETELETGRQLDTTIDVLSCLQSKHGDKLGRAYLEAIRTDVAKNTTQIPNPNFDPSQPPSEENPEFQLARLSEQEQSDLLSKLADIAATLDRMNGLIADPSEAAAFARIVSSSQFDISAEGNSSVFADLLVKVDASDQLSEDTKDKLHVQGLGVIRNSTDLIAASEMARETGQFVNPKTNRVEPFTEKNGMPLGDYTVYPDPKHPNEFVAKAEVGGRTLSVPYSLDDDPAFLNRLIKAAMVGGVLAERDFQGATREIFGKSNLAAQGYAEIKLDEEQVARAEQLYGAFMGLGTVLSSEFPNEGDLASFKWRLQATHIDGDAKTNDNTGRGDESWNKLGMLSNGHLNMTRVGEVGAYLNTKSTALPSFDDLEAKFGDNQDV